MTTAGDLYRYIDRMAPFHSAMSFDNPGLLVGAENQKVQKALLSLDITVPVVREAVSLGAQMIISHHPVIFQPLKRLRPATAPYLLAQNGLCAVCAHTNLDMASRGVNRRLAERLGLQNIRTLKEYEASGLPEALAGETETEMEPEEFAGFVKQRLGCDGLRYTDGQRKIRMVGLCSGSGAELVYEASDFGCQAFVTGESKHHLLLDAEAMNLTLVDAGHFYTEDVVIEPLMEDLRGAFPDVAFVKSVRMHSPAKFL